MAEAQRTNIKDLSSFRQLDLPGQLAVQLKANNRTYAQISTALEDTYGLKRAPETVRDWFRPGRSLTQALDEYNDFLATESMKETIMVLQRLTLPAVMTMAKLMEHENPRIRFIAAKFFIDKVIPDAPRPDRRRRKAYQEEPDIPLELQFHLEDFKAAEDSKPVEDRDIVAADWDTFMDAVRAESRRSADRNFHRLPPDLVKIPN